MASVSLEKIPSVESASVEEAAPPALSWLWWTVAVLMAPLIMLGPLLLVQMIRLWQQLPYRFYALALVANVLVAIWHHRPASPSERRFRAGVAVLLISTACGVLAAIFFLPAVAMVAAIGFFAGWMTTTWGRTRLSRIAVLTASWLVLVPSGMTAVLVDSLQQLSASYLGLMLDAVGLLHYRDGETILFRYFALPMTRIGGSVDSPIFFASLVFILLAMRWHGWIAGTIMAISTPVWYVIHCVLCGGLLAIYGDWQGDAAAALPFIPVRLLMLTVVVAAVVSWDVFLVGLTRPAGRVGETLDWQIDARRAADHGRVALVDGSSLWSSRRLRSTWAIAAGLLAVSAAIATVCIGIYPAAAVGWHEAAIGQTIGRLDRDTLPATDGSWVRIDYSAGPVRDPSGGERGRFRWIYQSGGLIGDFQLLVDPRWELAYEVSGQDVWRATGETRDDLKAAWRLAADGPIRMTALQNRIQQAGLLIAGRLDGQGRLQDILADPAASIDPWLPVWRKLREIQQNDGRGVAIASLLVRPTENEADAFAGRTAGDEIAEETARANDQAVDPAQSLQLYQRLLSHLLANN